VTADDHAARVVADADVLAADVLVGGAARQALDHLRRHSWTTLVASEPLLDDAEAVLAELGDDALAADWRAKTEHWAALVDHPPGDHPGLGAAYRGGAAHLLTFDEGLRSAGTNVSIQPRVQLSIRPPDAFARLFDAESLHEAVVGGTYPGPDRDPRA
jgi:hypothetical protein